MQASGGRVPGRAERLAEHGADARRELGAPVLRLERREAEGLRRAPKPASTPKLCANCSSARMRSSVGSSWTRKTQGSPRATSQLATASFAATISRSMRRCAPVSERGETPVGSRVSASSVTYASSRSSSTPPRAARTVDSRAAAVRSQRTTGRAASGMPAERPVVRNSSTASYERRACERITLSWRSIDRMPPSGSMRSSTVTASRSTPGSRLAASLEIASGSIGMTRPAR